MVHRDLITDEIERMGNVLRMILGRFLNIVPDDNINIAFNDANNQFSEQFKVEISDLLTLSFDELRDFVDLKHMTSEHCDQLAHILYIAGNNDESETKCQQYLSTADKFLEIAEQKTDILSLERMDLKSKIAKQLNKKRH